MKSLSKPTESELEILQDLWQQGPSTVREVNDRLNEKREIGYTTTLKFMQIMHEKGLVTRNRDGKSHVYAASAPQEETQRKLLDEFVENTFGGSAMKLVMSALGHSAASPDEIRQIRELLDQIEEEKK